MKTGCETLFEIPLSLTFRSSYDHNTIRESLNILCHPQHFIQRRCAFQNFLYAILS